MLRKNLIFPTPDIHFMADGGEEGGAGKEDGKEGENSDLKKVLEVMTGMKTTFETKIASLESQLSELKKVKKTDDDPDDDPDDDSDNDNKKKKSKKNEGEEKLTAKDIARIVSKTAAETYDKKKEADDKKVVMTMLLELSEDEKKELAIIPNYQNFKSDELKGLIAIIKKKAGTQSPAAGGSNPKQNAGTFNYKEFMDKLRGVKK